MKRIWIHLKRKIFMFTFSLRVILIAAIAVSASGCATILSGRTQTLTIDSSPQGARCEVIREGRIVAAVEQTPGAVMLEKTKHDLDIVCSKKGYTKSTGFAESGTEGATFGNILLGGVIGWGVDSAVGADNKYPERVMVNLTQGSTVPAKAPKAPESTPKAIRPTLGDSAKVKLSSLKDLKDAGLLTDEEYEAKRKEVISQM